MGCGSFGVDPEIAKLLASLDEKVEEFLKTFIEEAEKVNKELEEEIEKRHEELEKLKKENKEITEEKLKELNKKEIEKEIEVLSNEVDKLHYIFDLGLELVEPLKKITLNQLAEKAKSAPSFALQKINAQIEEVKSIPVLDFINSTYGKVLKDALAKKGISETLLNGFKKGIMAKRNKRREAERKEFGIKVNEYENEDIKNLKLNLMELIESESKELDKHIRNYVRDKVIEEMFSN